jgi:hypothetical protein
MNTHTSLECQSIEAQVDALDCDVTRFTHLVALNYQMMSLTSSGITLKTMGYVAFLQGILLKIRPVGGVLVVVVVMMMMVTLP